MTFRFTNPDELRRAKLADQTAIQLGTASGVWAKTGEEPARDDGGVFLRDEAGAGWQRLGSGSRVEARWFGVQADGKTDDAPALQRAIDALPDEGGWVQLPAGRMRCGQSLRIDRPYVTLAGVNCGLLSRHFDGKRTRIGHGSLLMLDPGVDGIRVQAPTPETPRLGGITIRDLGLAGQGRDQGQVGLQARPAEGRAWGSTDALLLERLYVIDCEWSAVLRTCDATVANQCWFSECGNGLHLDGCVYNVVAGPCFADNTHLGALVTGGTGNEIASGIFVRNEDSLIARKSKRLRVTGGTFETDRNGGAREDRSLIRAEDRAEVTVTGADFYVDGSAIAFGIVADDSSSVIQSGCRASGALQGVIPGPC